MEGCGDGDMKNHIVHVDDRQVTVDQKFVVANNKNVDTVELVLDGEWNGMDQIVVSFTNSNGMSAKVDYVGAKILIPPAVLSDSGILAVSVIGYRNNGNERTVTAKADCWLVVVESGSNDFSKPFPEQPDLLQKILQAQKQAEEAAKKANDAADRIGDIEFQASDYERLQNIPVLNDVKFEGNKQFSDYGLTSIDGEMLDNILNVMKDND